MNVIKMTGLFLGLAAVLGCALAPKEAHAQTKLVFAHYTVCFPTYNDGVAGYERDIKDAQKYGIDGFALNCGEWNDFYQKNTADMFTAAEHLHTGFKLFLSADMSDLKAPEILAMMQKYSGNPYYFKYKGRPVLSTFNGQSQTGSMGRANAAWWKDKVIDPLKTSNIDVYFLPYFYTDPIEETPTKAQIKSNLNGKVEHSDGTSYTGWWGDVAGGMFYFGAVGVPSYDGSPSLLTSAEAYADVMHENGKQFMGSISPQYWGRVQTNGRRYFEYEGPIGLKAQWESIIQKQHPEWVEIVTWNDFNETYISPIDDAYKHWPNFTSAGPGYYHSHEGLAALNAYYIDWYKHYSPKHAPPFPGKTDNMFWAYRTTPMDAPGVDDQYGKVTLFHGPAADAIYFVMMLKSPATLKVTSGSKVTSVDVPAGTSPVRIPFSIGKQTFELIRDGKTIVTAEGEDVVEKYVVDGKNIYNFWYTSGSARG